MHRVMLLLIPFACMHGTLLGQEADRLAQPRVTYPLSLQEFPANTRIMLESQSAVITVDSVIPSLCPTSVNVTQVSKQLGRDLSMGLGVLARHNVARLAAMSKSFNIDPQKAIVSHSTLVVSLEPPANKDQEIQMRVGVLFMMPGGVRILTAEGHEEIWTVKDNQIHLKKEGQFARLKLR